MIFCDLALGSSPAAEAAQYAPTPADRSPLLPPFLRPQTPKGRARKRLQYNRRFVNVVVGFGGKKKGPNSQVRRRLGRAGSEQQGPPPEGP